MTANAGKYAGRSRVGSVRPSQVVHSFGVGALIDLPNIITKGDKWGIQLDHILNNLDWEGFSGFIRDTLGNAEHTTMSVYVNGRVIRSCVTPVRRVADGEVTTIEGLSPDGNHPLQKAWVDLGVPQCGFCQAGQLMTASALLAKHHHPTDEQIDQSMAGNLCRCGTYGRIREGIKKVAGGRT